MQIKETTTHVTGAIQGARVISQHANRNSADKNLGRAKKKDPRALVYSLEEWNEGLAARKEGKQAPAPKTPAKKVAKKGKATGSAVFDPGEIFREGTAKHTLATVLADGQEHTIDELKAACQKAGCQTFQVVYRVFRNLREHKLTVELADSVVQVSR